MGAESRTLRIPAIAVIMKLKPETVHLQKLAVSTWFEQDLEVARFIYGTLKELVNLDARSHPEGTWVKDLSKKAKVVLPLAKPIPMILSGNQIYSGYLQNLGIGAYMLNSLMHGSDSAEFYHKTEYFLKQVQTTPVEFSVHMSGLKTIASQLMKSVSQNTEIHTQLRELIEKLEIAPRENAKLNLGAWIRLSDDINFAAELNQEDMETLTTKILSAFKDSGLSVMDKVCGRHPINYQNVFEELPYNAVVPSDLGLPIYVMTQMTYLHLSDSSCSVLHQLHAKRNEKEDCQLCLFQRDVLQSSMLRELSVERSSRNSSINLLPSRQRWINLSLANLAKFKNNDGA